MFNQYIVSIDKKFLFMKQHIIINANMIVTVNTITSFMATKIYFHINYLYMITEK